MAPKRISWTERMKRESSAQKKIDSKEIGIVRKKRERKQREL